MTYSIVAFVFGVAMVVATGLIFEEAEDMVWRMEREGKVVQMQLEEGL